MNNVAPLADAVRSELKVCPNPVFILGAPRSGTSVTAWALAQHPSLWTAGEIKLLWLLYGKRQLEAMYERAQRDPSGGFMRSCKVTWPEFAAATAASTSGWAPAWLSEAKPRRSGCALLGGGGAAAACRSSYGRRPSRRTRPSMRVRRR